jgi:hypothetical protein
MRSAPATPIAPPNSERPASVTTERLGSWRIGEPVALAAGVAPLLEVAAVLWARLPDPVPELLGRFRAVELLGARVVPGFDALDEVFASMSSGAARSVTSTSPSSDTGRRGTTPPFCL